MYWMKRRHFPFDGTIEFEDVESPERLTVDAKGIKPDYLEALGGVSRPSMRRNALSEH